MPMMAFSLPLGSSGSCGSEMFLLRGVLTVVHHKYEIDRILELYQVAV